MIVVTPEGRAIQDDREPTLEVLQELIKGYIEVVPKVHALCDEEGSLKGSPINKTASNWVGMALCGTVVFLTDKEWRKFCA
jgi:Domain of unknown function (DUF3846)